MIKGFAETLRTLRTERKMSQQQLAERVYVNRTTISKWEAGTRFPDAAMIFRLSKCFGVDADKLFEAVSNGKITTSEYKAALAGLKVIKKVS